MSRLLLLGPARDAAGVRTSEIDGTTVGEVITAATLLYGRNFAEIVAVSQIWLNGNTVPLDQEVSPSDEIAVVPPISGG